MNIMTHTATPESIAHYLRPEVKAAIQRIATQGDTSKCGNGDFIRWYRYPDTKTQKLFDLSNNQDYEYLINRHRTLYWSLNYFEHATYSRGEPKQTQPTTLGKPSETTDYTLGIDVDHCDGTDIHTPEVKKAVEDMAQFYCDKLREHQPKSVFSCYSGGGIYVYLHHRLWSKVLDNDKDKSLFVLVNCFNEWITNTQDQFFELYPQHKMLCKADALNNTKRIFKSILSIHKSLPYCVIPLDVNNIHINFDNAKLPLSNDIINITNNWYIYEEEPNLIQFELIPYFDDIDAKYDKKYDNKPIEVSDKVFGDIDTFPPCIRAIINSKPIPVGKTRAITVLATFLGQVGWDEQQARDLFGAVAADMNANTSNIFETWFKKMKCPSCATIKSRVKGFPKMSMGDTKFCTPDSKCKTIKSPFRYVVPEKTKPISKPVELGTQTNDNKGYHWTDLGNAQRLKDTYGDRFRYCHPMNSWLVWDNTRWNLDKEAWIEQVGARGVLKQLFAEATNIDDFEDRKIKMSMALKAQASSRIAGMITLAKSEPGIPIIPEVLDKDKMLFNVQNGTIDLRTGVLKTHTKTDYITKVSPVTYDNKASCPRWLTFLDRIFDKKKGIIEYMQRKCGYILTGETSEEEMDELYGTGNNGKSKFVEEIMYIMGEYAMKINVETIQDASERTSGGSSSSDVARLKGARLVVVSEPKKATQLNEQRIKDWTGRDHITARHLYQEPITFLPEFKLWIYTNYQLRIRGTDNGIWRRVKLIPFNVKIVGDEIDKHLDKKLLAESSGILNWMIEGCLMWQKDGLKVPNEIIEATEDYREEQDYLGEFFKVCCDLNKNSVCSFKSVFLVYRAYCKLMDMTPQQRISFGDTLKSKDFKAVHKKEGNFYSGFNLKPLIEEEYHSMTSGTGYGEGERVSEMSQFLETFLNTASREDFTENDSQRSPRSPTKEVDNVSKQKPSGDENNCRSPIQPTDSDKSNSQQISENLSTVKSYTYCNDSIVNNLTEFIKTVSSNYKARINSEINSTNISHFSMWFCTQYKPQWKINGKFGDYQPSMIRGIASKIFKLTPPYDEVS